MEAERARASQQPGAAGLPLAAAALAVLLAAGSLATGLQGEDSALLAAARAAPLGLPVGVVPDATHATYATKLAGGLPWFTPDHFRVAFWRPAGGLLLALDARLWPGAPWAFHLHSLGWLAAFVALGVGLLRRWCPERPTLLLATALLVVAPGPLAAAGWVANRPALVAGVFSLAALLAHERWRREGWRPGAWLAPLALAAAFTANESALCGALLLVAHALTTEGTWRARTRALAGTLLVTAPWALHYALGGWGVRGSGLYLSPLGAPFWAAAPGRWLASAAGLYAVPPAEGWTFGMLSRHALGWSLVAAGLVALVLVGARQALRGVPGAAGGRFLLLGAVLAPVATLPTASADRVLVIPAVVAAAVVAHVAVALARGELLPRPRVLGLAALALLGLRLATSTLGAPLRALAIAPSAAQTRAAVATAFTGLRGDEERLVLVNAPDAYHGFLALAAGRARGEPVPPCATTLYGGLEALTLTRLDAHTLRASAPRGFVASWVNRVFHDPTRPRRAGEGVQLRGLQLIIDRVNARGEPLVVRLVTGVPLDDPSNAWRWWDGRAYRPFALPAVGQRVVVPALVDERALAALRVGPGG